MEQTSLVVVGAGPYGLSTAAYAIERGIQTVVVGRPMSFWTEHMPADMFLRSGPDWHLDAAGVHTFETYLEEKDLSGETIDPVPIGVFLGYADWFRQQSKVAVRAQLATSVTAGDGGFSVRLDSGDVIGAEAVVVAPGPGPFRQLPEWAERIPPELGSHTCDAVEFDDLGGARVVIVGGRQSAYEWAALLADHGAERVDVVHRHPEPRFGRVSWSFAEPHIASTVAERGWWRRLGPARQEEITAEFWGAGRLTLEWWLVPRLDPRIVHRRPGTSVAGVSVGGSTCRLTLSDGQRLSADRVIFATGYRADVARIGYLADLMPLIDVDDGFPVLDEAMQTSVPGLYAPGFLATRDFGPFFGFTRGCPVAATLIVDDLLTRPM